MTVRTHLGRRTILLAGGILAALVALPATAGAVLSGLNGNIVFSSGRNEANDLTAKLYLRNLHSGSASATITPTGLIQHRHPTWSPDRTMIAYAAGDNATANYDIYLLDLVTPGATPQNITNTNNVTDDRPAWSPDGTRIAYDSENTDGSNQLNIKIYDVATGIPTNFTDLTANTYEHKPAWTPDSQTLFYGIGDLSMAVPNDLDIVRHPIAGTPMTITAGGASEFQPSVSPDGTQICLTKGDFGSATALVYTALTNGATQMPLPGNSGTGNYNCTWSPDGTKIAYVQGTFSSGDLVIENSDLSGGLQTIESTMSRFDGNPDWAPDGRPACQDITVTTAIDTPVAVPLTCFDTGPTYEHSEVQVELKSNPDLPHGILRPIQPGNPPTVTFVPDITFTGTDSFRFGSSDEVGPGGEATATINVVRPPTGLRAAALKKCKRKKKKKARKKCRRRALKLPV